MWEVLYHCKSMQTEEKFICSLSTANVNGRALVINVMVCFNYLLQLCSFRVDVLSTEVMLWYILIKSLQCYLLFLEGGKCNLQNSSLSGKKRIHPRARKYLYLLKQISSIIKEKKTVPPRFSALVKSIFQNEILTRRRKEKCDRRVKARVLQ